MDLSKEQQKFLLDVALRAIKHYLAERKPLEIETDDAVLRKKRGAFVTLKVDDQLRGCIGYPIPHKPLIETIIDSAIAAAFQDYRFSSIKTEELAGLKVEISVLTLPRKIKDVSEIIIGEHGIIISKGAAVDLLVLFSESGRKAEFLAGFLQKRGHVGRRGQCHLGPCFRICGRQNPFLDKWIFKHFCHVFDF